MIDLDLAEQHARWLAENIDLDLADETPDSHRFVTETVPALVAELRAAREVVEAVRRVDYVPADMEAYYADQKARKLALERAKGGGAMP